MYFFTMIIEFFIFRGNLSKVVECIFDIQRIGVVL